jgi:hypothetical protein
MGSKAEVPLLLALLARCGSSRLGGRPYLLGDELDERPKRLAEYRTSDFVASSRHAGDGDPESRTPLWATGRWSGF